MEELVIEFAWFTLLVMLVAIVVAVVVLVLVGVTWLWETGKELIENGN